MLYACIVSEIMLPSKMFTFLALSLEAEEERRRCEEGQKDATLLALKMEEEAQSQEMWVSSRG